MKQLMSLALLATAAVLSSCGSNHTPKLPTSADWEAQLTGGTGPAATLNFLLNFNPSVTNGNSGQNANIGQFSFLKANSCFPVSIVSASLNLANDLSTSQVRGSIVLTVKSETGNILTLSAAPPTGELIATSKNGVLTNGVVNGSWWLTPGSSSSETACAAGSATSPLPFTMCQNAASCPAASGALISSS